MGKYFKEFCDRQNKLSSGHVRDALDMEQYNKDFAVMALLRDSGQQALADLYPSMSNEGKNECYQSVEYIIRDCIDKYNYGVDLDKELAGDIPLTNGERACV